MIRWLVIALSLVSTVQALEDKPWYPQPLQVIARGGYVFQTFSNPVNETSHTGFAGVELSPWDRWDADFELAITGTNLSGVFFDYGALQVRYLLMDDVIGDPFSLSAGLAIIVPSSTSRQDFATYHLSPVDFWLHLAVGKERARCLTWVHRAWGVIGLMVPVNGWPQLRGKLAAEYKGFCSARIEAFVEGLYGLGGRDLPQFSEFHGYGPIKTRAVDIGAHYEQWLSDLGSVTMAYRWRPLGINYPKEAHLVSVTIRVPLNF